MKKVLSIALSVMLIMSALSVLMILPATANSEIPDAPVNLIVNGDFAGIDTDGDGVKDKLEYTADDQAASTYDGEFIATRPVGWRVNSATYGNAKVYWPSTCKPAGYLTNYVGTAAVINNGSQMLQDITFEAGKTYTISAKLGYTTTTTYWDNASWKIAMYVDAKTGIENGSCPSQSGAFAQVKPLVATVANPGEETPLYGAGDLTDHTITFVADDFIAANGLTADENGKYHARLVFHNYMWAGYAGLVDEVTMYEIAGSVTAAKGGMVNTDFAYAGCKSTLVATPFYGNTFAGWYEGDTLISTDATYVGVVTSDIVAKFNVYNQVDDGNFESGTNAGADYLNANKN